MLNFVEAIEIYNRCLKSDKAPENTMRTHMSAINRFYKRIIRVCLHCL